jgi:hypothetical protein
MLSSQIIHPPNRNPPEAIAYTIGFIRLSGYSTSMRISSIVEALSLDEFFAFGNPFDIHSRKKPSL